MSTVNQNVLRLALIVDPTTKGTQSVAPATFSTATIGTVAGGRFTAQRLLDVYNEARMALAGAMHDMFTPTQFSEQANGLLLNTTTLSFSGGAATKPTGYISAVGLTDVSGGRIYIIPLSQKENYRNLETSTNRFVIEYGLTFNALTGSTNIPNVSTYILDYFGVTLYTLTDVTNQSTVEQFNDKWYPKLVEIAVAIANEQSQGEVNALARKLLGA